jgi:FMN-dependent NADH-azoreductase
MKITIFNGSPKAEKGNTHLMAREFAKGAESAGATVEIIFLAHKKIEHCMACNVCFYQTPGECCIKDDVPELLDKWFQSDIVVHASPLHIGSVSGIYKDFLDRTSCHYDCSFTIEKETGYYCCGYREKNPPPMVIISNCCMPQQYHFEYYRSIFKFIELQTNSKIIAEIYRGGGEALQLPLPEVQVAVENYKKLLFKAGEEVVKFKKLSEETKIELEKPLIPDERYIEIFLEMLK